MTKPPRAGVEADPWTHLRRLTPARVALGRAGAGLPTRAHLELALAHARARDAVHAPLDVDAVVDDLREAGFVGLRVESQARGKSEYLERPDLGKRLDPTSARGIKSFARARDSEPSNRRPDLACVIGDGLSARAAQIHAVPVLTRLRSLLEGRGVQVAPIVPVAEGARVALGDQIGHLLGAAAVLVLIGERPGLTAPDSLGAYLTLGPRVGRTDAERNCVSNIRPQGLPYEAAATRLAWLVQASLRRKLSGVALKDRSPSELGPGD